MEKKRSGAFLLNFEKGQVCGGLIVRNKLSMAHNKVSKIESFSLPVSFQDM
jgi:hypothetical protein